MAQVDEPASNGNHSGGGDDREEPSALAALFRKEVCCTASTCSAALANLPLSLAGIFDIIETGKQ